jgi:uracil phosphoribosyltransferase
MVATGNTAIAALGMMKEWGLSMDKVSFLGIIASKGALESIEKKFPEVNVSISSPEGNLADANPVLLCCRR